jgi:beta-phosphoglucomutase-like phosphatase (HAD superfamily)
MLGWEETVTQVKAFVTDLDGALITSQHLWPDIDKRFFLRQIGEEGWRKWEPRWLEMRAKGVQMDVMLRVCLEDFSTQKDEEGKEWTVAAFKEARENTMFAVYREVGLEPRPGAVEILKHAKARGVPVAIASGMSPRIIRTVVGDIMGWEELIAVMASSHECTDNKPDPGVHRLAAERLKVEPASCVAATHSLRSYRAAAKAGMQAHAIPETSEQRAAFTEAGIATTVSLHDLLPLL